MELIRENIVLSGHIGSARSQVLLEGDIIVPDIRPDIASVLSVSARTNISKVVLNAGRILFSGRLNVDVIYLAASGEVQVHSLTAQVPVDDFLNVDGAMPAMWVDLDATLANVEHSIVNDRKLNFRVVVDVRASVWQNQNLEAVRRIEGIADSQQKTACFALHNTLTKQMEQFTIRNEVIIPPNRPAVQDILTVGINIISREVNLAAGRIDLSGDLIIRPLYKGDAGDSMVEIVEFELPFSGSLDIASAHEAGMADVVLSVADQLVEVMPDAEGTNRVMSIEVVINADVKISESKEIEILEDAYCLEQNLNMETKSVEYCGVICKNKNQFNMKENVKPIGTAEVLQVLAVHGIAHVEECKVVEDKVVVEGMVEADILYLANCDEKPMHSYRAHLPFRQVIETKGARVGMVAKIRHSLDHIAFNMQGQNEVELRLSISFDTTVQEEKTLHFIHDIEFSPLDLALIDSLPSMVIMSAGQSDSLWSVAKRYNADLNELTQINELDPGAPLTQGQKLLIVKKVAQV